jgi:hypothetical protein
MRDRRAKFDETMMNMHKNQLRIVIQIKHSSSIQSLNHLLLLNHLILDLLFLVLFGRLVQEYWLPNLFKPMAFPLYLS